MKIGGWRKAGWGVAGVMVGERGGPAGGWAKRLPGIEMWCGLICLCTLLDVTLSFSPNLSAPQKQGCLGAGRN